MNRRCVKVRKKEQIRRNHEHQHHIPHGEGLEKGLQMLTNDCRHHLPLSLPDSSYRDEDSEEHWRVRITSGKGL